MPIGRSWTYAAKQMYDPIKEITVVVASKDVAGYVFAGGAKDQVIYPLLWGSQFYGPHALKLTILVDGKSFQTIHVFPLPDGQA